MGADTLRTAVMDYLRAESFLEERRGDAGGMDAARDALDRARRDLEASSHAGGSAEAGPLAEAARRYLDAVGGVEMEASDTARLGAVSAAGRELRDQLRASAAAAAGPGPGRHRVRRILVALDASEPASWAQDFAAELASSLGANLVLLHVLQPVNAFEDAVAYESGFRPPEYRRRCERMLRDAERRVPPGVPVTTALWEGDAARKIAKAAIVYGADLIVIGTHGRGRLAQLLVGGTAQAVVRYAVCPVVTVGAPPAPSAQPVAQAAGTAAGRG